MILDATLSSNVNKQSSAQDSDHVTAQANVQAHLEQVQRLLSMMEQDEYRLAELMQLVGLTIAQLSKRII